MTDAGLSRALRSVGMAAFVRHLDIFAGPLPAPAAAADRESATGWRPTACMTRVNYARAILSADRRDNALRMIAAAARVDAATGQRARALLTQAPGAF